MVSPTPNPAVSPTLNPTVSPRPHVSVHAYPWDVLGDPGFAARARACGADSVTLAIGYHATRAATPHHPHRRYVDAHRTALYRPVRAPAWAGRRLVPLGPDWLREPDPAGTAVAALAEAGLPVTAWIVLAHNSRLGRRHPDLTVVNCFGEPYPYALCPARPEVREHCATLTAEALHGLPAGAVHGVSLESAGQLGAVHADCHEKTDGAYGPETLRALSVCCCGACREGWRAAGLDAAEVVRQLRRAAADGAPLPAGTGEAVLAVRHAAADALRRGAVAAARAALPAVPVTLHAHPDPWATGPSPGLTAVAAAEVDAVLVPCWPTGAESAELLRRAALRHPVVDAYVTLLPPADPARLPGHVRRLRAAGASRLSLYHLGLAPADRLPLAAVLAAEFRAAPAAPAAPADPQRPAPEPAPEPAPAPRSPSASEIGAR
ncbi:hypothetical protein ACGF0D_16055 [Kitasatospora sp. NPDC048298]|uniref:hypothetical protein n=1 Tax=Kitasatospora sp. NPDC048298 TaxID=3364049 RepID=UPI003711E625